MNKTLTYILHPDVLFISLCKHGMMPFVSDKIFLKIEFKRRLGYDLNIKNPKTFNEKLQWLKLYDRKPIYSTMVDKYEAKKYVAKKIGEEYIIPTYGVWNSSNEIDFDNIPELPALVPKF